ncbi:hypothetical protein MC378_10430 [Polaribacter sp. MSW13]|uniref:Uncharacterized protein n=1 Tax=Polaribacter marinus TaxID=2916838 RepID=A0A9X1VN41_9FLAO|nr:hypothetical protein [Polaribacter marinus]MCI2229584.1 hypothetical protein [Polaribacter marinus]
MEKVYTKFSEITKTQISDWKKTKGKLKQIDIPLDDNDFDGKDKTASFVICPPTRNILSAISHYGADKNIDKVNDLLIQNCVLGGDMQYLDEATGDTAVFLSVLDEVGKLMEKKRVISKNL